MEVSIALSRELGSSVFVLLLKQQGHYAQIEQKEYAIQICIGI